jgi:hypothetical protein
LPRLQSLGERAYRLSADFDIIGFSRGGMIAQHADLKRRALELT